jgi:hypothetical protein
MAQWMGMGGGHTRATQVADLEASLRSAVETLNSDCPEEDRPRKAKAIRKLAERLLAARLRLLKVRILESSNNAGLKARVAAAREAGIEGTLSEFDAQL